MNLLKPWKISQQERILTTPIFTIDSHKASNHEKSGTFYKLNAPNWINVIALTENQEIVLIYQYRHGIDKVSLEIPGGAIDSNEDPLEAAKRELKEETGYESANWIDLGKTSVNPAFMNNYTFLFLAKECKLTSKQELDLMEEIQVINVPKQDFIDKIVNEEIDHSLILAAVCKALLKNVF